MVSSQTLRSRLDPSELAEIRTELRALQAAVVELRRTVEETRLPTRVHADYGGRIAVGYPQVKAVYHWEIDGVSYFFTLLDTDRREDELAVYRLQAELRADHDVEQFVFDRTTTLQRLQNAEADVDDFLGPRARLIFHRQD
ncbi:MAG: hypothetical protein AVDCRST_MAG88-674 [uncultured Thermomicrobiales bacterium]|uniref:Uncharacterized protein n=1 Tax=uncultured Thermomicrobiales bacterium TaxID=1645740 RepID=A0A6J4UJS4_9BACT|nr:MAG: hypothetical protein AVDCRST_MAG88-674 [uncultured Thermomicrobiales bacterium]